MPRPTSLREAYAKQREEQRQQRDDSPEYADRERMQRLAAVYQAEPELAKYWPFELTQRLRKWISDEMKAEMEAPKTD